jgi:hypothetical protein
MVNYNYKMAYRIFLSIKLLVCGFVMFSCSRNDNASSFNKIRQSQGSREMKMMKASEKLIPLNDSKQFLGQDPVYFLLGNDSALIIGRRFIHLYVNNSFHRSLGTLGRGPKEYGSVNAFSVSGDTLFILDDTNAKIVGYSVSNATCLYELKSAIFIAQGLTSIIRKDGRFILANCQYVPQEFIKANVEGSGTESLFWMLYDNGEAQPLDFQRKNLNFYDVFPLISGPYMGRGLRAKGNFVYACFHLAKQAVILDLTTLTFRTVDIQLDIADPTKKITLDKITFNGLDLVENIFPLSDGFAINSKVVRNDKVKQIIRFYSDTGEYKGFLVNNHSEIFTNTGAWLSHLTDTEYRILYTNRPEDKSPFVCSLLIGEYK